MASDHWRCFGHSQNRVDAGALIEMVSLKPGVSALSKGEIVVAGRESGADADEAVASEGQFKFQVETATGP